MTRIVRTDQPCPYRFNLWVYNGLDCMVTHEVYAVIAQGDEVAQGVYDYERGMQAPALQMMVRGTLIDQPLRARFLKTMLAYRDGLQGELNVLAGASWGKPLNARSIPQFRAFFYDHLGCEPIWKENAKGEDILAADEDARGKLSKNRTAKPFLDKIEAIVTVAKKTDVLRCRVDPDDHMRSSYNVGATTTLRWSSSAGAFGAGTNEQNITNEMRRIFIPNEGWKLAYSDLERAESVCLAYLAEDEAYMEALKARDHHAAVAGMVWGIPPERARDHYPGHDRFSYRDVAKRLAHATDGGGTFRGLARTLHLSEALVEDFQQRYFAQFPGILAYQKRIRAVFAKSGQVPEVTTPMGVRRYFMGRPWDRSTWRQAYDYEKQSMVSHILNLGLYGVWHDLEPAGNIQVLKNGHDAILWQYRLDNDQEALIRSVEGLMSIPVQVHGRTMVIPVETKVGFNWADYTTETQAVELRAEGNPLAEANPNGLTKWGTDVERGQQPPVYHPTLHGTD